MTTTDTAPENFVCPHCQKEIEAAEVIAAAAVLMGKMGGSAKSDRKTVAARDNGRMGGLAKSERKAASSAENGKKGGRPRKPKPDAKTEAQP